MTMIKKNTLLVLFCLSLLSPLCFGEETLEAVRTRFPLLMESALLPDRGSVLIYCGVEFEEDSGDFPTTKFPAQLYWAQSDRLLFGFAAEMVIFNIGPLTSSGLTNPSLSLLYQAVRATGKRPAVTLRQDLLPPVGGFSTGRLNGTSSLLLTWRRSTWLIHTNASYSEGSHDAKPILVSEVDRWRAMVGAHYLSSWRGWTILGAFTAAKPIRPKKVEPSIELGFQRNLASGWSVHLGTGKRLRAHVAPEYLFRFTLGRTF